MGLSLCLWQIVLFVLNYELPMSPKQAPLTSDSILFITRLINLNAN